MRPIGVLPFAVLLGYPPLVEYFVASGASSELLVAAAATTTTTAAAAAVTGDSPSPQRLLDSSSSGGGAHSCHAKPAIGWKHCAAYLSTLGHCPVAVTVASSPSPMEGSLLHWASLSLRNPGTRISILRALASAKDALPREALAAAASVGAVEIVLELVERGGCVGVDEIDATSGWSPLMFACGAGEDECDFACVDELLRLGADINFTKAEAPGSGPWGGVGAASGGPVTPLGVASDCGFQTLVSHLLRAGATASVQDLIAASQRGHAGVLRELLAHLRGGGGGGSGATNPASFTTVVNARDEKKGGGGRTPLMYAAQGGHVDAVRVLLQFGADPAARGLGSPGKTARQLAEGHAEIVDLLDQALR